MTSQGCDHFNGSKPHWVMIFAATVVAPVLVACQSADPARDTSVQAAIRDIELIPEWSTYAYRYPDLPPVLDADGLEAFLDEYRHQVVVLAFWASWSQEGREDIAGLAQLHNELADQGLCVIACTFDPAEEWTTRTVPILQGARAGFPCVVIPREARNRLRDWLAKDWSYDLPARFVIDRQGEIVAREFSGRTLEAIVAQARKSVMGNEPVGALVKSRSDGRRP